MKDRIRLGNKKDKVIKTNLPENISTVEELVKVLNAGIYADIEANNDTGDNAGVVQAGTPLSKGTLLSDQTAERLALHQEDPTVNDALNRLANQKQGEFSSFYMFIRGELFREYED